VDFYGSTLLVSEWFDTLEDEDDAVASETNASCSKWLSNASSNLEQQIQQQCLLEMGASYKRVHRSKEYEQLNHMEHKESMELNVEFSSIQKRIF